MITVVFKRQIRTPTLTCDVGERRPCTPEEAYAFIVQDLADLAPGETLPPAAPDDTPAPAEVP